MNCIKCGREIPEGELFCAVCAMPSVAARSETIAEPKKEKVKRVRKKKAPDGKAVRGLRTALIICICLLLAVCALVGLAANEYLERREALRIREASVTLREKEADNRDNQIAALKTELQEAEKTIRALQSQRAD